MSAIAVSILLGGYTLVAERQHAKAVARAVDTATSRGLSEEKIQLAREEAKDATMPRWPEMWKGLVQVCSPHPRSDERWLIEDGKATAKRIFLSLGATVIISSIIGIFAGCFYSFGALMNPIITFIAKVPPTAALPIFFVFLGTDELMFVGVAVFGTVATLSTAISLAVRDVPDETINKAYTIGASHGEVVWNVVARQVFPHIIDGVRISLSPILVYLIAAEMISSDVGFGYRIRLQARVLDMKIVYPYLVILAAFGFFMDYALRFLQAKLCSWFNRKEN